MQSVREAPKSLAKLPEPEGTWIRITFTLDPGQYQKLWELAEAEHRTISGIVHDRVTGFLEKS